MSHLEEQTKVAPALLIDASPMKRQPKFPHAPAERSTILSREHPYVIDRSQAVSYCNCNCVGRQVAISTEETKANQVSNFHQLQVATNNRFDKQTKQPFLKMGETSKCGAQPPLLIQTQHGPALLLSPIESSRAVAQQRLIKTAVAATASDRKPQLWSKEEDAILKKAVQQESGKKYRWMDIAKKYFLDSRTAVQCKNRWNKSLQPGIVRGNWRKEEDALIVKLREEGYQWKSIAIHLPGRIGEQIRDRYVNVLDKHLSTDPWTQEEDRVLFYEQRRLGNKWTEIASFLGGRSENSVKNRWYNLNKSLQRKRKGRVEKCKRRLTKKAAAKKLSGNKSFAVFEI